MIKFNKAVCAEVAARAAELLKPLEKEYGLKVRTKGGSYNNFTYTAKLEFYQEGTNGEALTSEALAFKNNAIFFDMKPEDLYRQFEHNGDIYKIVGLKPKSYKYPIIAERSDGRRFKFPAKLVASKLTFNMA